jgi:proteic killer suppression protein
MIISFGNRLAKDLVEDITTKDTRGFPKGLRIAARRKLNILHAARAVQDLKIPPGNRLEALKGEFKGRFSIRINDQWRITFEFLDGQASDVKVEDYHK